ncbi:glycoside hydrolase 43 family protein [uncultured Arcticibacterium sp.]|uniref:glycoside hydrolase family 43 protein n=1 Tax=uncultured Arcticibacterium sp. TaxID=2173042 RepID=UPI0030FC72EC
MKKILFLILVMGSAFRLSAQEEVYNPNLPDGKYKNPIIHADYSDPDAIRVGDDYFMVSSSFSHFPGLPILHSKDLVNWEIIGHAALSYPDAVFENPQHGDAIWAPSIRYHDGEYFIYYGDPDRGVFMTKTTDPFGKWEPLKLIKKVVGWIDCCPLWDDDGKAYLVHAYANSRSGIKSVLLINEMTPDGNEILGTSTLVFNGQKGHETIEGPKLYKRKDYYYIFAPAGGVSTGWQTILRSKKIYGPYVDKIVLEQGSTNINGPHQGAWLDTQTGEEWFIHFQDKMAYGRVVLLQPMSWKDGWPVMGVDYDGNGVGEPVAEFKKPNIGKVFSDVKVPQTSDEFNATKLGLQWQWQANSKKEWYALTGKSLRLNAQKFDYNNLWPVSSILLQKFPAMDFAASTKLKLNALTEGEKAGLIVFGMDYAYVSIEKKGTKYLVKMVACMDAEGGKDEKILDVIEIDQNDIHFKVEVTSSTNAKNVPVAKCQFAYSLDGKKFTTLEESFKANKGKWVGAKVGLFATSKEEKAGYVEADWFRISK